MGKLQNGKATGKNAVTGKMIKSRCDMMVDWLWKLSNIAFQSGGVPEDCGSAVVVPLYSGTGERNKYIFIDILTC